MKKLALIYCRVSSDRQVNEGHGLDSQEKRCRNYSSSQNYIVEKVFYEEGISGGLFDRPAMKEMLSYIDKHINNEYVIIVDDIKRLARDVEVHFQIKSEIYGRGSSLESPNFKFEDTPEGKFAETVVAASSELDRRQNRRQVLQKMKARLEMGFWPFCTPPGLVNVTDALDRKKLVPREPYASIYKEAIQRYIDDELNTLQEVRSFIESRYRINKIDKSISVNGTHNILTEELYCGYIEYKPWEISFKKAQHDGFITLDMYKRVRLKLDNKSKPRMRTDYNPLFPLRGLVLCSKCNKPMTGSRNKGRNKHYDNYSCKTTDCDRRYKSISTDRLHGDFEQTLIRCRPPPELTELAKIVITDLWNEKVKLNTKDMLLKNTSIKVLDDRIAETAKLSVLSSSSSVRSAYEKTIEGFTLEKSVLEDSLVNPPEYTQEKLGTATDMVMNILKDPVLMWKNEDPEVRKTIVYMYFDTKPTYDYITGFGTSNLALPIKLINSLTKGQSRDVEMPGFEPGSEKRQTSCLAQDKILFM